MSNTKSTAEVLSGSRELGSAQLETTYELSSEVKIETIETLSETAGLQYVHYKRRWFGVLIFVLINLMTSWGVRFLLSRFYDIARITD
jgi:hypothetical protein